MIAYADTSTLVKAISNEPEAERADQIWLSADVVFSSRVTYAEARAAMARFNRSGRSTDEEHLGARDELESRWRQVIKVDVTDRLVRLAGDVADRRGLRGYDAVHLASALMLDEDLLMVTWDRELASAALEEGLSVLGA